MGVIRFKYDFPIKPHLKAFLAKELGLDFLKGDRWQMNYRNIYGKYALLLLGSSRISHLSRASFESDVRIPFDISRNNHFGHIPKNINNNIVWSHFNNFIDQMFDRCFCNFVDARILDSNKTRKLASKLILEFYKAEDVGIQLRLSKVFANTIVHKTRKDAILEFMTEYGITEDDLSFETLERLHKRELKKKGKKLTFLAPESRVFSSYEINANHRHTK